MMLTLIIITSLISAYRVLGRPGRCELDRGVGPGHRVAAPHTDGQAGGQRQLHLPAPLHPQAGHQPQAEEQHQRSGPSR